jgi:aminoglycoside phosphotransferase (APT) family kinase protein
VALTVERDLDELRTGIERWLDRPVTTLVRPDPGYSCETVIVDDDLVLRMPPAGDGIFPRYDLPQQAKVQDAAGAAGIPVAGPTRVERDPSFLGAPFVAMPFVAGAIPAAFTPADPWLNDLATDAERRTVWEGFLDVAVAIHRTPVDELDLRAGLNQELDEWDEYARWSTDGSPPAALADVLLWCRTHRPTAEPPVGLLWGDVRFENVIFDPETARPAAVLDWDMASVGPFELDLGWFLALGHVQDAFAAPPAGFGTHDEAIARVEAQLGRELHDIGWYEVFALARASAIATRITVLQQRAGQHPMFGLGEDPTITAALDQIDRLGGGT